MANIVQAYSDDDIYVPQEREKLMAEEVTNGAVEVGNYDDEDLSDWNEGVIDLWKRSHGFIKYTNEDGDDASMFFHHSAVYTNDKKPYLRKGMAVQFRIKSASNEEEKPSAVVVEGINGCPLDFHARHGDQDTYDREIQCNGQFFNGEVSFYSRRRNYGRVAPNVEELKTYGLTDAEIDELGDAYFKECDLDYEEYPFKIRREDRVRFQLFNSTRGWGAMNVQLQNGQPIPKFTEEDREVYNATRKDRQDNEEVDATDEQPRRNRNRSGRGRRGDRGGRNRNRNRRGDRGDDRDDDDKDDRPRRNNRRRRNDRDSEPAEPVDMSKFRKVPENKRFKGKVISFALHKFGFIEPEERYNLGDFGILKRNRLCFRVTDVNTRARPPMVDADAIVTYSLIRNDKGILYAVNVSDEFDEDIVAERKYEAPEPKKLDGTDYHRGSVLFYNWRRGHGRIQLDNDDEERYYFHRDDIKTTDKLPGVAAGDVIICQKVRDERGAAVTNVKNTDHSAISGFDVTAVTSRRE